MSQGRDEISMQTDIANFLQLDAKLKENRKKMKAARETMNEAKQRIISRMVQTKTDKIMGLNGDTQYLECVLKRVKVRPTTEQMMCAADKAIRSGVTNPAALIKLIQESGGVREEYRLMKKTRRIAATAVAIQALQRSSDVTKKRKTHE